MEFYLNVDVTPKYVRRRLDAILVAGSFRTVDLKDMDVYGIPWLKLIVDIITNDDVFRDLVLKTIDEEVRAAVHRLREKKGYSRTGGGLDFTEYEELVRLNVLRDLAGPEAYEWMAKLFKVPKGNDLARLIMDASEGNIASNTPPRFSLAKCEEIRRRIFDLGPCVFVSADLRHWFYQIGICPAFQAIMTFYLKKRVRGEGSGRNAGRNEIVRGCPLVLPMGHKWSPYLAQGCCWSMIFLDADPTKDGFTIKIPRDEMPTFVEFFYPDGTLAGFVTVYYDNVLIVSKDKAFADRWIEKLKEAEAKTGGQWKVPKDGPAIAGPDEHVAFIGVQYLWQGADLLWWWPDSERKRWEEENVWTEGHAWTPREMHSYLGTLMWTARIREVPLCEFAGAMALIGIVEKFATQQSWDYELSQSEIERHNINGLMTQIRQEILTTHVKRRTAEGTPKRIVFIATDASTSIGLGAIWMDRTRKPTRIWQRRHNEHEATKCSNWVEIRAIYEAILQTEEEDIVIRLATDNACAIQAILKGWSRSPEVVKYVKLIYRLITARRQKLSLVHVIGKDNVADTPSRFMTAEKAVADKKFRTKEDFDIEETRKLHATCDILFGMSEARWEGVNKGW